MAPVPASVLAINGGSSSIKFAVYQAGALPKSSLSGTLDRIGRGGTTLSWCATEGASFEGHTEVPDDKPASRLLIDWLEAREEFAGVSAVGHRVVHGMAHPEPARVTPDVVDELRRATSYAPDHLPLEIELIEAFHERHPHLPQVACFDTAFHRGMPPVARLLPIPRRYQVKGVQRYGFHGLSYAYLIEELARAAGPEAAHGRVILAHLGNGASLAAVQGGTSIDTSMGFTPAAGLVMSTRTGDLDPGLVSFLAHTEQMTATEFHQMINHESGLLGVSETSADMRGLLVACVVGDGEAETAALATGRHSNKFLNPVHDGAVLPILHVKGYKIAGPMSSRATTRWTCTSVWPQRSTPSSRRFAPSSATPARMGSRRVRAGP